jgi:enterochelin esterase-like enzyme
VLLGASGAAGLSAAGLLLGDSGVRHRLRAAVRPVPQPPHPVPAGPAGTVVEGAFASAAMRMRVGWSVIYPPGTWPGMRLPCLLVLHGRGDDHRSAAGSHRLGAFLGATVRAGIPSFAVAAVDGGDHSYWHRRQDGTDPQAMILDELLPVLASRGLRTGRFAVGGWSMGGYGALLLTERLGPDRVVACAVDSPALWLRPGDSAPGAFDRPADFRAHDVLAQHARLGGVPLRVACGTSDPFLPGVKALLSAVPTALRDLSPGGHDLAFWQHAAPAQLAFVGQHLRTA